MWLGITYLTRDDTGDEEQVLVAVWDHARPWRVAGSARSVADIVCALREAGSNTTTMPRCDGCDRELDLPDLDTPPRVPA